MEDVLFTPIIILSVIFTLILYITKGRHFGSWVIMFNIVSIGLVYYFIKNDLILYSFGIMVLVVVINPIFKKIAEYKEYKKRYYY